MIFTFLNAPPLEGDLPQSYLVPLKAKPGDPGKDERFKYVLTYIRQATAALRGSLASAESRCLETLAGSASRIWMVIAGAALMGFLFVAVGSASAVLSCPTKSPRLLSFMALGVAAAAAWLPLCRRLLLESLSRRHVSDATPCAPGQDTGWDRQYTFDLDIHRDAHLEGPSASLAFYCAMAVAAGKLSKPVFSWQQRLAEANLVAAANVNFATGEFMPLSQASGRDFEAKVRALCEYQKGACTPGSRLTPIQLAVFSFRDRDAVESHWLKHAGWEMQMVETQPSRVEGTTAELGGLRFLFCKNLSSFKGYLAPRDWAWFALRLSVIPLLLLALLVQDPEPPRFRIECRPAPCSQSDQLHEVSVRPGSVESIGVIVESAGSPGPITVVVRSNRGQTLSEPISEEARERTSHLTLGNTDGQASFLYTMPEAQPPPVVVVTVTVTNSCGLNTQQNIVFSSD